MIRLDSYNLIINILKSYSIYGYCVMRLITSRYPIWMGYSWPTIWIRKYSIQMAKINI